MLTTRLRFIEPQLASPVDQPPEGEHWIHEIKHDGYRCQVLLEQGEARVFTRNGYDWSDRYPWSISDALLLAGQRRTAPLGTPLPRRQKFSAS
jgi:ATP-dependent DNA ligase